MNHAQPIPTCAAFNDKQKCYCYFWYVLLLTQNRNVIIDKHILHFKTCYVVFTCNVNLYVLFLQLDNTTALFSLHLLKENNQARLYGFLVFYVHHKISSPAHNTIMYSTASAEPS